MQFGASGIASIPVFYPVLNPFVLGQLQVKCQGLRETYSAKPVLWKSFRSCLALILCSQPFDMTIDSSLTWNKGTLFSKMRLMSLERMYTKFRTILPALDKKQMHYENEFHKLAFVESLQGTVWQIGCGVHFAGLQYITETLQRYGLSWWLLRPHYSSSFHFSGNPTWYVMEFPHFLELTCSQNDVLNHCLFVVEMGLQRNTPNRSMAVVCRLLFWQVTRRGRALRGRQGFVRCDHQEGFKIL